LIKSTKNKKVELKTVKINTENNSTLDL